MLASVPVCMLPEAIFEDYRFAHVVRNLIAIQHVDTRLRQDFKFVYQPRFSILTVEQYPWPHLCVTGGPALLHKTLSFPPRLYSQLSPTLPMSLATPESISAKVIPLH